MEYYINLTNKCNLRCSFCCSGKIVFKNHQKELDDNGINNILSYIRRDIHSRSKEINRIVFYGGEPFIVPHIIENIIKNTADLKAEYMLYTNGTLIDKMPPSILKSLDIILVSFDGDKNAQEKYRGKGTYQKVIGNLKKLSPKIKNKIIGRITVEEETDILKSVINVLKYVSVVHWQIVNKPKFKNDKRFIANYNKQVAKLWNYWLKNLENGKILKIIPFQAIVSSLLNKNQIRKSFRCGCGYFMQMIDMNGKIYDCPESIGFKNRIVGSIYKGNSGLRYEKHTDIWEECKKCPISVICLGRCKKNLKIYNQKHLREYCEMTKFLISIISNDANRIKSAMHQNKFTLNKIYSGPFCTEEIP